MHSYTPTTTFSKAPPLFRVSSNNSSQVNEYPLQQHKMTIGREKVYIPIYEEVVSNPHFEIQEDNGLFYLVHPHPSRTETANGFIYQGRRYQGHEHVRHLLQHGDVFHIGEAGGVVVTLIYDDGSSTIHTMLPEDIYLGKHTLTIGRAQESDIFLDHETVSVHHARLEKQGRGYRIIDLQSTNHVYVNNICITSQDLQQDNEIKIGPFKLLYDERNQVLRRRENRNIRIDVEHLSKIVPGKTKNKALLSDISLVIPPGSFVALVGGSGAGKSTLLKALSGLNPAIGTVNYNQEDYYKSFAAFSTSIGYVPQDDIVHRELTVQDALYYAAKLRLPSDYTPNQLQKRIDEVIQEVELNGRGEMFIHKLSGGQRKRVSIAIELLANPSVFFLDEPTSGLDPGLDRKMMNLLRKLADKGQTIVLVTHATSNINICHYVCFMGAGRLIYFGTPFETMEFFKKGDFSEIYNELEDVQRCKQESERFRASPDYTKYITSRLQPIRPQPGNLTRLKKSKQNRFFQQWFCLCQRYMTLLKNDRWNLALLILQAPIIALIIFTFIHVGIGVGGFDTSNVVRCPQTAQILTAKGYPDIPSPSSPEVSHDCGRLEKWLQTNPIGQAYVHRRGEKVRQVLQDFIIPGPGDAPIILFIMAFAALMCGCINSSREIVKEDPIYRRERAVNLHISSYLFSKMIVLGVLCLLQSLALVVVIGLADPFPHGTFLPGWLEIYITIALTSLAGLMLGLTVSAIVPNSDRAMSFLPLLLLPQIIFSGTLFPLHDLVSQCIAFLFPVRWAMAALGSTVGIHSDKVFGPSQKGDQLFGNNYSYHGTLFSTYSTSDATSYLLYMWFALTVSIVFFMLLTWLFLKWKDRRSFGLVQKSCIRCQHPLAYPNQPICSNCQEEQFA